jgi:hypothetical protein
MTPVKKKVCEQVWDKVDDQIGKSLAQPPGSLLGQPPESLGWKIWAKIEVPVRNQVKFTANQVENQFKSKMR